MVGQSETRSASGIKFWFPVLVALALILIFRLPLRTGTYAAFMPFVSLAFVYYWVLYGRQFVPFWLVFFLGLFEDMVTLGPAGLNSIILLAVAVGLTNQRRFFVNRPFFVGWAGFAIVCIGVTILRWLLESIYASDFLAVEPLASQAVMTVLFFPVFGWIFGWMRKRLRSY